MPRDDLSIDFIGRKMPQTEHQDCAAVLDEWTNRVANLPAEIAFMQEEIAEKDRLMAECLSIITKSDNSIQKWIRINGSHTPNPREEQLSKIILENYDKAQILQAEKIALAQKTQQVIDKHTRYLDAHIKALQDKGEFPNDPDIPSLLRPSAQDRTTMVRADNATATMPLGQITNSANVAQRQIQHSSMSRINLGQAQPHMGSQVAASAPATPTASMLLNRQARESSLGASNKRQKLTGGLGTLPANPSGLARHASMGPSTPKAGTPSAIRAGSAGPRTGQKTTTAKKVAPHRQGGIVRKNKPGKSGLSRVKRSGTKNSPTSTNDSELSEVDSASADEEDETATPPPTGKGDGDEDMAEGDDDEGGDDKKYCICQSVSYGDMVACDNESCPYEWFHWTCVGLKSEPEGTWICPVCTKNKKK
ncbi:inhibitor of growth proteins N-terminal histone-binding-domain-containing protein [Xylogone sp. PMI_703]|nr:inhibitor of growth proteins N-terminal histone-binding-domain-containing protein [Xylogone sp. PMI_703]